jgi:hypothetical protein
MFALSDVCSSGDSVEKVFLADERKFLGPLMRFVRGDVRDHIVSPKIDHRLRSSATKRRSGREVEKSTFARFSVSSDFRLLQQYQRQSGKHMLALSFSGFDPMDIRWAQIAAQRALCALSGSRGRPILLVSGLRLAGLQGANWYTIPTNPR